MEDFAGVQTKRDGGTESGPNNNTEGLTGNGTCDGGRTKELLYLKSPSEGLEYLLSFNRYSRGFRSVRSLLLSVTGPSSGALRRMVETEPLQKLPTQSQMSRDFAHTIIVNGVSIQYFTFTQLSTLREYWYGRCVFRSHL